MANVFQQPYVGGQVNTYRAQPGQVMMMQPQVQMMAPGMMPYQPQMSMPSALPASNYMLQGGGQLGYAGQMGTGTGLVDTSNSVLTNRNKALTSVAQVKVKEAQFVAEAEGARVIAEGYWPLWHQSQVIIRRAEGKEGHWKLLSYNKLPMYEAAFSMFYLSTLSLKILYFQPLFILEFVCLPNAKCYSIFTSNRHKILQFVRTLELLVLITMRKIALIV